MQLSANKKVTAACFDNSLFYKGFLLQTSGQIKRMSLSNPVATENFNLLKSYERRLAAQYAQPIADRDSTSIIDLETKANDLEKNLARTVAGFGQALRQVKWQEVQTALKPGEAAIEFVSYRFYRKKQTDSIHYAALLLLPGSNSPKFIPLFEEKQLTALLKTEGSPQPIFYNDLYASAKKGETGLGDLVGNEGVYGLQRALKIAGARYLIMSLWQVPDFQAQVFMTAFYKHWLEGKKTVPEAFRATQAELRGRYSSEAFKWAGFVLVE